jgi:glycosyltransferase involved in cell wall biosynthesis
VRDRLIEINGTPPDRTFLVYNGIDLTRFEQREPGALHRVIGVSDDVPIVFSSGRAQPYKGIQVVIAAAALMRDAGRRVEFVFCGDGSYLAELKQMAEQHRLTNFHFLGRRRDVPELLGSAAVAVVPSLWAEAFGLTVVEAMVARVPLVATRTGGIPELVEDGVTGLLIEPNDANQMASAITRLLEDPVRSAVMAGRAAETARDRFSLERAAENLYAVVSRVLDSPARMSRAPATGTLSAR